jgi:hypothetical protein
MLSLLNNTIATSAKLFPFGIISFYILNFSETFDLFKV